MDIITKHYPNEDHLLVFDNASSCQHLTTTAKLTNETVPKKTSVYTATKTTITATTVPVNTNNASNTVHINTATIMNHTNSQPQPSTYTHEEVQQLLEDAQLKGWKRNGKGIQDGKEERC